VQNFRKSNHHKELHQAVFRVIRPEKRQVSSFWRETCVLQGLRTDARICSEKEVIKRGRKKQGEGDVSTMNQENNRGAILK